MQEREQKQSRSRDERRRSVGRHIGGNRDRERGILLVRIRSNKWKGRSMSRSKGRIKGEAGTRKW